MEAFPSLPYQSPTVSPAAAAVVSVFAVAVFVAVAADIIAVAAPFVGASAAYVVDADACALVAGDVQKTFAGHLNDKVPGGNTRLAYYCRDIPDLSILGEKSPQPVLGDNRRHLMYRQLSLSGTYILRLKTVRF